MKQVVISVAIACASLGSRATADPKADAKLHIDRAAAHYAGERYTEALDELTKAYELDPAPGLLYSIAQVNVKLDRCAVAITFYERFLGTNPAPKPSAAAREAIAACQKLVDSATPAPKPQPAAEPDRAPVAAPRPVAESTPPEPPPSTPVVDTAGTSRAWYRDPLGGVLLGGGVVAGVGAVVLFRAATRDNDAAAAAPDYGASEALVDRARGKRTYAAVAAAGSTVLIGAAIVRYVLIRSDEESGIALVPAPTGVEMVWSGRF